MVRKLFVAAPFLLLIVVMSTPAFAMKMVYSANFGLNKPFLDDGNDYDGGLNIEFVGQLPLPFPLFNLELEAKLGANTFTAIGGNGTNAKLFRGSVGVRGGINFAAYPYGYAHIGYGSLSGPWVHSAESIAAPVAEIGLGLDITAVPYIRVGLFGAYNHMVIPEDAQLSSSTDRDVQWFSFGLKLGYVSDGG
jgi:hypothetical protein